MSLKNLSKLFSGKARSIELQRNGLADYFEWHRPRLSMSCNQIFLIRDIESGRRRIYQNLRLDMDKRLHAHLLSEGIGNRISENNALQIIKRMMDQVYYTRNCLSDEVRCHRQGHWHTFKPEDNIRTTFESITAVMAWDNRKT